MVRCAYDALRIGRRAGGVRDERGLPRVDARGRAHRIAVGERREREQTGRNIVVGHDGDELEVGSIGADRVQVREVVEVAEAVGRHEDAAPDCRRMNPTSFTP